MITGATRLAGVIGDPVRHSMSPVIHNAAYAATGLDWVYVAVPVPEGRVEAALAGALALGVEGLSVTMPHKATVARHCDRLTESATRLGVVNAVRLSEGEVIGHNTDGTGFLVALANAGWRAEGRSVVVVGAGGTARALSAALVAAGASRVVVAARRVEAAREVADLVGPGVSPSPLAELPRAEWERADLVANTTPVGMAGGPDPDGLPVPVEALSPECRVIDAVYHPLVTPLLKAARERGLDTMGGVELLVGVSAEVFAWWTGVTAPIDVMSQAALTHIDSLE
ncbi:MAG: shikimate dehydrogenase [Microthrixaceae bacterium]|nr:shikimate dehydrogenase [Microthrixaceae bacterium]